MASEVTRIFRISPEDVVVMRHAPLTDSYEITLNGVAVHSFEEPNGKRWFANKKKRYVLTTKAASSTLWFISRTLGNCAYELEVDGVRCKENNEMLSEEVPYVKTTNLVVNEYVIQGDGVVWYLIRWPECNVHVHRRYRDFYALYQQVSSAFRGSHLYASLPEPPPKEMLPSSSSNRTPAFLENRMRQLEIFLKRLNNYPGVRGGLNPDVQEFLGIGSARLEVFETSVVFGEGKLGIKLKSPMASSPSEIATFSAQVAGVLSNPNESQAARLDPNRIRVGDMITRVGGESALLVKYDKVISLLQNSALRPVVVHLLGVREHETGYESVERVEEGISSATANAKDTSEAIISNGNDTMTRADEDLLFENSYGN